MNTEQLEQVKQYEWDKFNRRYPTVTGKGWFSKIMFMFSKDVAYLVWENGFYRGWEQCLKKDK